MANFDQILSELFFGWQNGCHMFSGILDKKYGFHGNQRITSTYNGNTVATVLSPSFFTQSSFLQVTRTTIKSWMNIGPIEPPKNASNSISS